jgi:predicted DNA-binding transcriptional regulator YafY
MVKISEKSHKERKDRILLLIQRNPNGVSELDIARTLNFNRRTANNYLRELEMEGKIYKDGQFWCPLPYEAILPRKPDIQAEEAVILYLAIRLFVKQTDRRNETAETVLLKLASILSDDIRLGDDLRQAAHELAQRPREPGHEDRFRTVIRSYIYHRKLKILYEPYRGEPFETLFSPYLLEPSAIGLSTYAIGYSETVQALRTYKIERIRRAELTRVEFEVPSDFPGLDLLRNAWSIFYGEEVVRVMLRFRPEVARRLRESNWHPSQQIVDDDVHPGCVLLAFDVADTTDLLPWIRTWGANCEVLEPAELRDDMMSEARRIAELYGWHIRRSPIEDVDDALGLSDTLGDYFGEE